MDIWYKPKYVFKLNNFKEGFYDKDFIYRIYSGLEEKLVEDALFQLEISVIIKPNQNIEFNISELFNKFIKKQTEVKKYLEINQFNILFFVNKQYICAWPEKTESTFAKSFLEKDKDNSNMSILTFDEFMVKSLLE